MDKYAKATKELAPKKRKLKEAQRQLHGALAALNAGIFILLFAMQYVAALNAGITLYSCRTCSSQCRYLIYACVCMSGLNAGLSLYMYILHIYMYRFIYTLSLSLSLSCELLEHLSMYIYPSCSLLRALALSIV